MPLLHHNASKQSVDFVRFWIFGICLVYAALDPFQQLPAPLSILFEPKGLLLRILPEETLELIFSKTGLWSLKVLLISSLALVLANKFRAFSMLIACVLLTLWQSINRSYGHVNHSETALLHLSYLLTFFEWANPRIKNTTINLNAVVLITLSFFLCLPYMQIGINRLVFGQIDVYTSDSLLFWIFKNSNRDTPYPWHMEQLALELNWLMAMLKIGFPVVTIFEILAPVTLVSKWFRYAFLLVIVSFHLLSLVFMKIFFWENTLLFVLLLDFTKWVTPKQEGGKPIVFFDGVCGLCNKFVDKLIRLDQEEVYVFASLQSNIAKELIGKLPNDERNWSIILKNNQGIFKRSEAIIRIIDGLGGPYKLLNVLRFFPAILRDSVYNFVAVNRYRWFGKRESCRLPTKEEKKRFIE